MPIKNEGSTRLRDELRIISPWAYGFAILGFLSMIAVVVAATLTDKNPPPMAAMVPVGIFAGTAMGCYILLIGYVNADAGRRGMNRLGWTLLAIFIPNALGIVLYFIMRKPRIGHCPQCGETLDSGFGFCPHCGYKLGPLCSQCHRSVSASDKFCPYCGNDLGKKANEVVGAGVKSGL